MRDRQYTLKSLIGMALQYQSKRSKSVDDRYWPIVRRLHFWASPEIVATGLKLYDSHNWHKRLLAVNIFNQLLIKVKKYESIPYAVEDSQFILLKALDDVQSEIIASGITGLGHRPKSSAISRLVSFFNHENESIRYALAFALGRYDDDIAIEALLILATDKDDDVRDWATFALGSMHETIDTPAIRELLWQNMHDSNESVGGEALVGLAIRKDKRVVDVLKIRLTSDCTGYDFSAAEHIADSSLYPHLVKLAAFVEQEINDNRECSSYWVSQLYSAMEACKPKV